MTPFAAFTTYGVRILNSSAATRSEALAWAAENAEDWPGCRIVRTFDDGRTRTIWKHTPKPEALERELEDMIYAHHTF